MQVTLHWDNDETIVRREFAGMVGMIDYLIPIKETAGMGVMAGARGCYRQFGVETAPAQSTITRIEKTNTGDPQLWPRRCGDRRQNPIARWIISAGLLNDDAMRQVCAVALSLAAAHARLTELRRDGPSPGIEMGE